MSRVRCGRQVRLWGRPAADVGSGGDGARSNDHRRATPTSDADERRRRETMGSRTWVRTARPAGRSGGDRALGQRRTPPEGPCIESMDRRVHELLAWTARRYGAGERFHEGRFAIPAGSDPGATPSSCGLAQRGRTSQQQSEAVEARRNSRSIRESSMARPRKPLDPARREALLRHARRHFASNGYEAASVSKINQAADFPRSSFYYFFGEKDALFEAAFSDG